MKAHIFQHVPYEDLGSIESWLAQRQAEVGWTRFYLDPTLPVLDDVDLLIVLGGSMSVNHEIKFPWLVDEKRFIRAAVDAGKSVLGICLGAQLIASAFGERVYPSRQKEMGWFAMEAVAGDPARFAFPSNTFVFQWHSETFDLPPGAIWLARSVACTHQAFQLGERTIGLQCHLEATPESVAQLLDECGSELAQENIGNTVQSATEIRALSSAHYSTSNTLMQRLLDFLVR